jgi:hypothetical protein
MVIKFRRAVGDLWIDEAERSMRILLGIVQSE